ncbi:proline oxidase [Diplodia corticola]|uniref:Proline dehydrogenase n=1 Tax=Diplodia corticola TaxID=236234 RepID=A0A1J9SEN3_9PEZI|nr:proline oxidase [Diplodia corticola]OJD38037.1 proline oxidase [Diplodia corticola]
MAYTIVRRTPATTAWRIQSTQQQRTCRSTRKITTISTERRGSISQQQKDASKQNCTEVDPAALPPLSALPTSMLLRSVFINAISSKPFLLSPSLAILSALSKPSRSWVLNVDRNPLLHSLLKATFYKQFCAGETGGEVTQTMRRLREIGFRGTILTYAKETVFDHRTNTEHGMGIASKEDGEPAWCEEIAAWREGTLETVDLLEEGDQLALKLTGAGPLATSRLHTGAPPPRQLLSALREICQRARARGARVIIDAESQRFQAGIERVGLHLMREHNRNRSAGGPAPALVYNTYQAYLKSTPARLAAHLGAAQDEGFTLGLKLVRGAYMASDERRLICDSKQDTDAAYDGIAQGALRCRIGDFGGEGAGSRPFPSVDLLLAGHNEKSLRAAHALHAERVAGELPTVPVAFAQLHGMADGVSFGLVRRRDGEGRGPEVYKCSTWGSLGECLAYLTRRAVENRDAAGRTKEEYAALKREVGRRLGVVLRAPGRWFAGAK